MSDLAVIKEIEGIIGEKLEEKDFNSVWGKSKSYALNTQKQLIALNLERCELKDISFLKNCTQLQQLYLCRNQLSDINALARLINLTELDLRVNQLSDINSLAGLINLTTLVLSHNQLSDINALSGLINLTTLILNHNQLSDINALTGLINLTTLILSHNQLTPLPEWTLNLGLDIEWGSYKKGLHLQGNPLESPPIEIIQQGNAAIKAYFDSLKEPQRPLNEFKVLFIGDGGAGKTSLSKVLRNETFNAQESQTHGINIHHWQHQNLTLHYWDFGGQQIMHATHQFFLSKRSLYILVLDGRKEEDAEYWLKHIESFGGASPVLIVLNKIDEHPSFDVNRKHLLDKYSSIIGFYKVSCQTKEGLNAFKKAFINTFNSVEMLQTTWGQSWFEVKTTLESWTAHYISCEQYRQLCREHKIIEPKTQDILAQYLHDLGVVVYFADFELKDTHVLQPQWLTEAVYKIINAKQLAVKYGVLYLDDLSVILEPKNEQDYSYPSEKHRHIIELMKKFELCYSVNNQALLIPDLLEVQEPEFNFPSAKLLRFRIQYDFLPKSVMARFIVKRHLEIKDNLRWRTGAVLYDNSTQATALIRADNQDKTIDIQVSGLQKRDYFAVIHNTLTEIHNSFEKLTITELVPLPDNPSITVEYQELIGYEIMGKDKYTVGKLRKDYDVAELLNGIEKRENRELAQQRIINNYGDYHEGDKLETIRNIKAKNYIEGDNNGDIAGHDIIKTQSNNEDIKSLLADLLLQIEQLKHKVPAENSAMLVQINNDATTLVNEIHSEQPRKQWCDLSLESIKNTAIKIGDIAVPIISLVEKITPFL
ncbi:MAG: COR domain-containing protein [Methylococcaceae bacterium]